MRRRCWSSAGRTTSVRVRFVHDAHGVPGSPAALAIAPQRDFTHLDQGGCAETSKPTTHTDPVYVVDGVIHYCVANMPGAVPITSTKALTNATLPYVEAIATHGLMEAVAIDPGLAPGVNVLEGKVTYEAVAEAHGLSYTPLFEVLA